MEDARHVLHWLRERGGVAVTWRELHQALRGRFPRAEALDGALALLVEHGHVRRQPEPARSGPGRRPSAAYELNPFVLAQHPQNPQNWGRPADSEEYEDCEDYPAAA